MLDELLRLGVPLERMMIEQQMGGDEMDLCADISGELALFELKDKEFSLGNAYPFGAKIGILRPNHSVIVTTEYVGADAKEHFERAGTSPWISYRQEAWLMGVGEPPEEGVLYIEGIDSLRTSLEGLVSQIHAKEAVSLLGNVLPRAAIDARTVVDRLAPPRPAGVDASEPGAA